MPPARTEPASSGYSLRYLAEDGAVPGRYLLGDKAQPGGEVAAFGEHIACADCRYHRAGDDRPDTRLSFGLQYFDPFDRRVLAVALASSELAGIAETWRARV